MTGFTGLDGWPCEFEQSPVGMALIAAVRDLPGADALAESEAVAEAKLLHFVSLAGQDDELPRSRPASQKASEKEIARLVELASSLADHIDTLRRPAVSALFGEGADVFTFAAQVREMAETARIAYSEIDVATPPRGAPKKLEAAEVTYWAAFTYQKITRSPVTFTTTDTTHGAKISGAWPDFLAAVFEALRIDASVESQVRGLKLKARRKPL